MSRVQLALNVGDLDAAIEFYSKLFGASPAKVRDGYAIVLMQFAPPAVIEQPECRVTLLLNFGQHDAGAEGVDRASRDKDDIAFRNRTPLNQFDDRAVPDRRPQFLWRHPMIQANADLRVRLCR